MPPLIGMTLGEYTAIMSLGLNILVAVVGATWGIAKIKDTVRDAMEMHRKEVNDQMDTLSRSFGETVAALREKINQVELDMANNYTRRQSVYSLREELRTELRELGKELKESLQRMEAKLDSKT